MPAPKHDNQHGLRASTAQKQTSDDGSVKGLSSPADQQTLYSTPYLISILNSTLQTVIRCKIVLCTTVYTPEMVLPRDGLTSSGDGNI